MPRGPQGGLRHGRNNSRAGKSDAPPALFTVRQGVRQDRKRNKAWRLTPPHSNYIGYTSLGCLRSHASKA